jgi:hypothetical protein
MKKALLYFVLYRLLDLESILWGWKDSVSHLRTKVAMKLHDITHSS